MLRTPNPKRILHILSGRGPGGTRAMYLRYHKALLLLGHTAIACVRNNSYVLQKIQENNYAHYIMRYQRWFITPSTTYHLSTIYKKSHPDLLIVHNKKDAKLWRGIVPHAYIILILHEENFSAIQYADFVITVNDFLGQKLTDIYHKPSAVLPNCIIDPQDYLLPIQELKEITTFGYLGKIRRHKGIFLLLHALSMLPDEMPWRIVIQGEGHIKKIAHLYAYLLGIQHKIIWKKWGDITDFFEHIDILVVPSYKESFGLVILEALMHHRKVLMTDTHGPQMICKKLHIYNNMCLAEHDSLSKKLLYSILHYDKVMTASPTTVWEHFGTPVFTAQLEHILTHVPCSSHKV